MLDVTISWAADLAHHVAALAPKVPNPGDGAEPPFAGKVKTLLKWAMWGGLTCCVAGFIIIGARMGVSHKRGEGGAHMASLAIVGFACVLIASAYQIVSKLT